MVGDIHLDDGLVVRFPGRNQEFAEGVEVGMLAALMDQGAYELQRWIRVSNLEQIRALAGKFGYRLMQGERSGTLTRVTLSQGRVRPRLRVVRS